MSISCERHVLPYTVIAYYTKDTPYETEIHNLRKSCAKFGLPYHFKWYESRGNWEKNCGIKPEFLRFMLEKVGTDCLYVDADAVFKQYPVLFDNYDYDIGVHYLNGVELLSGTLYLRYSRSVFDLLDDWIVSQRQYPEEWDQKILQSLLVDRSTVTVGQLPPQYTQIFDDMAHYGEPVIQHNQASRRFKDAILRAACV